ncbi:hypothetical protein AB0J08_37850, partial [Kitasatospora sp. NPDC050463]
MPEQHGGSSEGLGPGSEGGRRPGARGGSSIGDAARPGSQDTPRGGGRPGARRASERTPATRGRRPTPGRLRNTAARGGGVLAADGSVDNDATLERYAEMARG